MPHFYFDLKDGIPVRDRAGYDCFDERQARHRADGLAEAAAIKHPKLVGKAYISVINDLGSEIYRSDLLSRPTKTIDAAG